jgi:F5/8 type C domain-containing protein
MKFCPYCKRTYSDPSLRFCLDDGTVLARDSNATLSYGATTDEGIPPTVASNAPAARHIPAIAPSSRENPPSAIATSSSTNPILTVGVISIALLLLILTLVGVTFLYLYRKTPEGTASQSTSSPAPTPSRASDNTDSEKVTPGAFQIKARASSVRYAVQANTYNPENVIDGSKLTAWIEGVDGPGIGEWLRFDFGREINLHRIMILPGYFKSPQIWAQNNRIAAATLQFSDGSSRHFTFPDIMERQTLDVGAIKTRWVRLVIDDVFKGTDPDSAISEVAFEWEP